MLVTYPTLFFIGPFIHLYQRAIFGHKYSLFRKWFILGIPILIYLLFIPYYLLDSTIKTTWSPFGGSEEYKWLASYLKIFLDWKFFLGFTIVYTVKTYYDAYNSTLSDIGNSATMQKKYKWFKLSLLAFIIIVCTNLIFIIFDYGYSTVFTLFLAISIHIIAYGAIIYSNVFDHKDPKDNIKYKTSPLTEVQIIGIKNRFNDFLVNEKPYLDDSFSLESATKLLNIPKHHLSQVINQEFESTFSKIIKDYRVEEACKLLELDAQNEKKIATIAYESGFADVSTFYRAFKELKKMSPSNYRESLF
ncbi:helix-turn-helix domain-containing protein [Aquimarina megaterium]|uniref:helix-turn-helix domain-containing protein n=1 Tax=Aquimarina megaterium TaxID=1443666 RepID=UPI0004726935|nr:AraC family transcriptional regulator [Aquimarina megaterium]